MVSKIIWGQVSVLYEIIIDVMIAPTTVIETPVILNIQMQDFSEVF